MLVKDPSHPGHGNAKCYIIGYWIFFSFLKMLHLSPKRLLKFLVTGVYVLKG